MRITFVRHTSVDVEPHTCYGQTDVDLKESFTTEASIVKKNIEDMGVSFGKVFTSPLKRARLLADFCGYTDAVADHRLMEMNFGEWEMQKYDRIKDPRLQEWMNDWLHVRATGGESAMDQMLRVKEFVEDSLELGEEEILVFTHGGVMACARCIAGICPPEKMFENQPSYGGILTLEFRSQENS